MQKHYYKNICNHCDKTYGEHRWIDDACPTKRRFSTKYKFKRIIMKQIANRAETLVIKFAPILAKINFIYLLTFVLECVKLCVNLKTT